MAVSGSRDGGFTSASRRGASLTGDGLVLASLMLSATFTVGQSRLLRGRDPIAAVQFLGAALWCPSPPRRERRLRRTPVLCWPPWS